MPKSKKLLALSILGTLLLTACDFTPVKRKDVPEEPKFTEAEEVEIEETTIYNIDSTLVRKGIYCTDSLKNNYLLLQYDSNSNTKAAIIAQTAEGYVSVVDGECMAYDIDMPDFDQKITRVTITTPDNQEYWYSYKVDNHEKLMDVSGIYDCESLTKDEAIMYINKMISSPFAAAPSRQHQFLDNYCDATFINGYEYDYMGKANIMATYTYDDREYAYYITNGLFDNSCVEFHVGTYAPEESYSDMNTMWTHCSLENDIIEQGSHQNIYWDVTTVDDTCILTDMQSQGRQFNGKFINSETANKYLELAISNTIVPSSEDALSLWRK